VTVLLNSGTITTLGSREIWDRWIERHVNKVLPMKIKQGLRSRSLDPIGERDQWPIGIAGNRVAREIISQGGTAIQTTGSPRGYV
jgi:hypothetical protein